MFSEGKRLSASIELPLENLWFPFLLPIRVPRGIIIIAIVVIVRPIILPLVVTPAHVEREPLALPATRTSTLRFTFSLGRFDQFLRAILHS